MWLWLSHFSNSIEVNFISLNCIFPYIFLESQAKFYKYKRISASYMSENVHLLNHVSVMYLCIHVRMHSTISKCLFFLHNDMWTGGGRLTGTNTVTSFTEFRIQVGTLKRKQSQSHFFYIYNAHTSHMTEDMQKLRRIRGEHISTGLGEIDTQAVT